MNRIIWVDTLKGYLILLVMLGHIIQIIYGRNVGDVRLWNIIYSFHLPAFMAISGFTYKGLCHGNLYRKILRRFRQLIIPFIVWSLVQYVFFIINDIERPYGILGIFIIPDHYFWFLWVLFWIYFIMLLSDYASLKLHLPDTTPKIFCCIVLVMIMLVFNPRVLGIQFISYYFVFFYIGFLWGKRPWKFSMKKIYIMIAVSAWFFMAWEWHMHKLPIWISKIGIPCQSFTLLIYIFRGFTALLGIIGFLGLFKYLAPYTSKTIISDIGEYSLGIYVVHLVIIRSFITVLSDYGIREQSLLIFVSFALLAIISYIMVKALSINKYSSRILLGKI